MTGIHLRTERAYPDDMANRTDPIPYPTTDEPLRSRRWIPMSLRIFAALLLILGYATAWLGVRGYQPPQRGLITKLEGAIELRDW